MQTIRFRGHSDDIIYVECAGKENEYAARRHEGSPYAGTFSVEKVLVTAFYSPLGTGCWGFGISPTAEGVPFPNWSVRFAPDGNGYGSVLLIECPDDVRVFYMRE